MAFEEVKGPSEYVTVYTDMAILASLSAKDGKVSITRDSQGPALFYYFNDPVPERRNGKPLY